MSEQEILTKAPTVVTTTRDGQEVVDLVTYLFNKKRQIFLEGEVNQVSCFQICQQLQILEDRDPRKAIDLIIDSPGGSVDHGLTIIDVMKSLSCPVNTIVRGQAASMGAVILAAGAHRSAYKHSRVLVHQILGTGFGDAINLKRQKQDLLKMKERVNLALAKSSGKSLKEIEMATDRDNWMTAQEALEFGLIDEIIDGGKQDERR